jgi:polyisoprenoid-binding protein YceI
MKTRLALTAAAILAAAGSAALLAPSATTAAPAPAPAAAGAFTVDGTHSSVVFNVKHNNIANFWGAFGDVSGSFDLSDGGSVVVNINPDSVTTRNDRRDGHLRNQDFFSVKEFPELSFKSTSVKKVSENTFEAAGELTMHGVTKPLTVTIEQTGTAQGRGGPIAGMETKFTVKRSEFGMTYGLDKNALGDEVNVIVCLEGGQR